MGEGTLAVAAGQVRLDAGQLQREGAGGQRQRVVRLAAAGECDRGGGHVAGAVGDGAGVVGRVQPDDRERLAPVALPREQPVAELEVDGGLAGAPGREVRRDVLLRLGPVEPAVGAGGDEPAVAGVGQGRGGIVGRDDLDDGQGVLLRELVVARVVRRHGHDGAGAVAHQHVVGDPDGDAGAGEGVAGVGAAEDAGLVLGEVGALQVALAGDLLAVGGERRALLRRGQPVHQRVLRRQHQVGAAIERVRPRGEHGDYFIAAFKAKIYLYPLAPAYPVRLHGFNLFGPTVQSIQ